MFSRPKTFEGAKEKLFSMSETSLKGCIVFTGLKTLKGYGKIRFGGKHYRTHRLSYILNYGEISSKLLVCHKCDNPSCININHLFLGTAKDNAVDRKNKGRGNNQYTVDHAR